MAQFEFKTVEQLEAKSSELKKSGFVQSSANLSYELGKYDAQALVNAKKPVIFLITFKQTDPTTKKIIDKFFTGVYFKLKHMISGKTYDKAAVGLSEEIIRKISTPSNLAKTYTAECVEYTKVDKTKGKLVKIPELQ